ncbi:Gfo/Idh/MocA family protein [Streptomyces sp. NPDC059568]|uniref:Gfo/Idh/MocA family protein n=1 Tax=Streptomyces sp. NPDC059568 TaxID=3346868 RepID=UPI0036746B3F
MTMKPTDTATQTGAGDRPFRLALAGAGRMGRTHLRALAGSGTVEVVGVAEPVTAVRDRLAAEGLPVHPGLADVIAHARPDGILIAAPTGSHLEIVRTAVGAGVPVLCEKPAGLTSAEVREAERLAARHGVAFQVAYWRRYVPVVQSLRRRILSGALGEVHLVISSQWDGEPPSARFRTGSGGIFVDMGVHEFDQVRWLTGQEITGVQAVAAGFLSDPEAEGDVDSAQALLALSGGSTALVSLGRHFPDGDMATVEVFGTRGHERVTVLDPADGEAPMLDALRRQTEAFAAYVRSGTTAGAGTGDALAALHSAERATAAMRVRPPVDTADLPSSVPAGSALR